MSSQVGRKLWRPRRRWNIACCELAFWSGTIFPYVPSRRQRKPLTPLQSGRQGSGGPGKFHSLPEPGSPLAPHLPKHRLLDRIFNLQIIWPHVLAVIAFSTRICRAQTTALNVPLPFSSDTCRVRCDRHGTVKHKGEMQAQISARGGTPQRR